MGQRHDEIYLELRKEILDGTLKANAALPTFLQLGAKYNVSVATINKAVAKLKTDALVKTVRGSGVFVAGDVDRKRAAASIGIILPELGSGIYLEMIKGIFSAARERGVNVQLCDSDYDPEMELELIDDLMQSSRIKGLLLSPCGGAACKKRYEWLRDMDFPLVFIDRYVEGLDISSVSCDSVSGAREGVEKLIELGHRRIAFLSAENSFSHQWCKDRLQGYKEALSKAGLKYDKSLVADKVSAADVKSLLEKTEPPTAIFLASNRYLHRVLEGVELGNRDSMAIAGFDEADALVGSLTKAEIRRYMNAPLIKVLQPFHEMGRQAAKILCNALRGGAPLPRCITRLNPQILCDFKGKKP